MLLSQPNFNSNSTWVGVTWILLCTIIPLLRSHLSHKLKICLSMVEVRLYALRVFPLNQTKPNHQQNPTKWTTKHIQTYVVVTAQLQLQFNLSWCDLNLTLHNNSTPAQQPSTTQTLNMSLNCWTIFFFTPNPPPSQGFNQKIIFKDKSISFYYHYNLGSICPVVWCSLNCI